MDKFEFPKIEPVEFEIDNTIPHNIELLYQLFKAYLAMYYYEKLKIVIEHFQSDLKNNEYLQSEIILNDSSRILALSFGYYNSNMITIIGLNSNNEKVKLILPLNNIQIINTIKQAKKDEPKRKKEK